MAVRVDDTVFLDSSLVAWGVPETVRQALAAKGFTTMSLIAHALPSSDHLESFVDLVLGRPEGLALAFSRSLRSAPGREGMFCCGLRHVLSVGHPFLCPHCSETQAVCRGCHQNGY